MVYNVLKIWTYPVAIIVAFATLLLQPIVLDKRPPVLAVTHTVVTNNPIEEGQIAVFRSYRKKVREDCPVQSVRYAIGSDGRVHTLPPQQWQGGFMTEDFVDLYFDTSKLSKGEYNLLAVATYQCPGPIIGDDLIFIISTPQARLTIK